MTIFEKEQNIIQQDPAKPIQDSSLKKITVSADTAGIHDTLRSPVRDIPLKVKEPENADTAEISFNNRFSDKIFTGKQDLLQGYARDHSFRFPFNFIESAGTTAQLQNEPFTEHLRDGRTIPRLPFNNDWIIILVVISAFIYSTLSAFQGRLINNIKSFLLFKGIGDPSSRETGALFHWQSGILNFISFSGVALFLNLTADYYGFMPFGISGVILWLIFLSLVALIITLRFILCFLLGNITGETEVFGEYSATLFHSYHITGFFLFMLSVFLAYTDLFQPVILLDTGFVIISLFYLMRIIRLFLIFLKRDISILYLILYLCALEFLPVLIVLRYLTNLF